MRSGEHRYAMLQILPISAIAILFSTITHADDFPNELNSPIPEPRILLPEARDGSTIRFVSSTQIQSDDPLVRQVVETREACRRRLLSTSEHTPWQIMHGMLALRQDFVIRHNGQTVSGLDWISTGPTFRGEHWFQKTQYGGQGHPYSIPYAFEGHVNQFLAILTMSGLPLDHEFGTRDGMITMRDMLKNAQMTVNDREELTWTLWALSRYLPSDAQWVNARGEKWSIERLVRLETAKSLQGAPCGGTHNLFALAHARNVRLRSGAPLRGAWLEAEYKIRRYIQTARMQQNSNGLLSSNFFRGRDYKADFDRRMTSAGHLLEFLMIALPQKELSEPWVRRAIAATCNDLMANRRAYVGCSPLYHTVNALSIYLDRVAAVPAEVAKAPDKVRAVSRPRTLASEEKSTKPETTTDVSSKAEVVSSPEVARQPVDKPASSEGAATAESQPDALTDTEGAGKQSSTPIASTEEPLDLDAVSVSPPEDETAVQKPDASDTTESDKAESAMIPDTEETTEASVADKPNAPAAATAPEQEPETKVSPPMLKIPAVSADDSDTTKAEAAQKEETPAEQQTPQDTPAGEEPQASTTEDEKPAKDGDAPKSETAGEESDDASPAVLREAVEPLKSIPAETPKEDGKPDTAAVEIQPSVTVASLPPATRVADEKPSVRAASVILSMYGKWRATRQELKSALSPRKP